MCAAAWHSLMRACRAGDMQLRFATPAEKRDMPLEMQLWSERKQECDSLLLKVVLLMYFKEDLNKQPQAVQKVNTMLRSRECFPLCTWLQNLRP